MTYDEQHVAGTVDRLLTDNGIVGTLTPEKTNLLDQFHAGGTDAVDRTIQPLGLTAAGRVLDVGSGFGGPARRIAQQTGATVHGVDITAEYVDAATTLTARSNLAHLVTFEHVDIADHHPVLPYTAALSMHVQMNVADKRSWYREIAARVAPGAQFAVWDICITGDHEITWPMPWSIDGRDSFLVTPDALRTAITGAGFECLEWADEQAWVRDWFTRTFAAGPPSGPGLAMLLDDGLTRTINVAAAVDAGTITVVRGRFTTPMLQ